MKKEVLLERVCERTSISKSKANEMTNFLLMKIREALLENRVVKLTGFGSFRAKTNGSYNRVSFKPSKALLLRLNSESRAHKI